MIKLVRLDYRLLHGQVVFSWTGHVGAQRIIVVDDDAANDEMKKSALLLSKPAGVRVNIFTVDKAIAKMTIYTDTALKEYLEQAGFCQIQSHKNKRGWLCITAQK